MSIEEFFKIITQNPTITFIEGVIIVWIINKILDKTPNYIKYEGRYNIKSLTKWLFNSPIDVVLNYKITDLSIKMDDYEITIKDFMRKNSFKSEGQKGNDYIYTYKFGSINPELTLSPSYKFVENEKDVKETHIYCIETIIKIKAGFRSFNDDINETDKFKQQLNVIFKKEFNELGLDSTTFYLSNMYKLTGILKDIDLKSLYGKLGENKVELFDNKIIVYGMILTKELIKIKRVITYYY